MINTEELKRLLAYDPETGVFLRNRDMKGGFRKGEIAGSIKTDSGYMLIQFQGKQYRAHRLAWLYVYGSFPEGNIDHINRIKTDNRICNLRVVDQKINACNSRLSKKSTSGMRGVTWAKHVNRWRAQANCGNKLVYLGLHIEKIEAFLTRLTWEKECKSGIFFDTDALLRQVLKDEF